MKSFLFLFFLFFSLNIFAYDNLYKVDGVIESGGIVEGVVLDNIGDYDTVSGQLTDENGNVHSLEGKWVGNGLISGETDDGESVELRTK